MKTPPLTDSHNGFIKTFNQITSVHNRFQVFQDFVTMAAISLHNAVHMNDELELEYLSIINGYDRREVDLFPVLLGYTINLLEPTPRDVLGPLFMELELGNKHTGQFFTPPDLCDLMAQLNGPDLEKLDKPFIKLSEPCCGAGAMVLSFVKRMIAAKQNPADKLWVQCIDIDRTAALMCYVQLTLWNVPAQVIVGNTLTLEFREQWFTPAHWLFNWPTQLQMDNVLSLICESPATLESNQQDPQWQPAQRVIKPGKFEQISLF